MRARLRNTTLLTSLFTGALLHAQEAAKPGTIPSSYQPVALHEEFRSVVARMKAAKPDIMKRQLALLAERYDLSDHPDSGATMSRGKRIQTGVRVKLSDGVTW